MSENKQNVERMEDIEALLEKSLQNPSKGEVVEASVVLINKDEVIVDFGYKTEGVVARSEFGEDLKINDKIELSVVNVPSMGYVKLTSKTISEQNGRESIKNAFNENKPIEVKVLDYVDKKGFKAKWGDVEVFIPENHIDNVKDIEPKKYLGKTLFAKIMKVGDRKKSPLVSPRLYNSEEVQKQKIEFFSKVKIGDKLKGTVKTIKDYGAFVSFGMIDGFLHKNEINWGRVKNANKFLAEGDEVEVVVLELKQEDNKIAVGMKQLLDDPWLKAEKKYPVGENVKGTVVTRKRAGYVIEIEQGIDGFVPNEELSWLKNVRSTLNIKDVAEGKVLGYDTERKRVIMSVKDLSENPWVELKSSQKEGSVVSGTVKNITDFGMFIDFGSFIDGLIRKNDISWTEDVKDINDLYKVGDKVEAKIISIDEEKERVSLGIKQLVANPWKELNKLLPQGKVVEVPIVNITKTGLEVELPLQMKGFIGINDLDPAKTSLDNYNIGDIVSAIVIKTDTKEKQVTLSVKKYLNDSERRETREYMKKMADSDNAFGFGSILKDKLSKD